jgi:manganese/zinc/iron transport system permease protein
MLGVLLVNLAFLGLFYSKLKVTTFDAQFATSLGIRSGLLNTAFMFLVSVTVTAAFNAAGAILVIALVVVPAATAYLLTTRLPVMIALTAGIAVAGAIAGFWIAYVLDAATSAGMSVFYGLVFVVALASTRLRQWSPGRHPR